MTISPFRWCAALLLCAGAGQFAHAQVITDANTERGLRYPGTPSFDGEPWTQRYSYGTGGIFYLNGDARQLYYLDYLDRLDRAHKFGYRVPVNPYFDEPPPPPDVTPAAQPAPAGRVYIGAGGGLGWWRRR